MKAKLIRRDNGEFYLIDENNKITSHHHLSKQNCDEIFGVIDEDKKNLYYYKQVMNPYETGGQSYTAYEKGFIEGFNKAMELNKDKLFTLEDMKKAIQFGEYNTDIESFEEISEEDTLQFIESLQQPTEIDVVIEMENYGYCEGCRKAGMWHCAHADTCGNAETRKRPKLDLSECLILKKI
jgi:hypothetical protein